MKKIKIVFKNKELKEDGGIIGAPTNNVGGGAIAGVGVGPNGEPGISIKKKKIVLRRKGQNGK
jgi:hypothetical protein